MVVKFLLWQASVRRSIKNGTFKFFEKLNELVKLLNDYLDGKERKRRR